MTAVDWDRLKTYIDKSGMWNLIINFPQDLAKAYDLAVKCVENFAFREPENVVIAGMGGSAIGGDLTREYFFDKAQIPIHVTKWFKPPFFAGKKTLAIVSSYSGNTEETISMMKGFLEKGCEMVIISSNGFLEKVAERKNIPFIKIPSGRPPRTALAYLYVPMLVLLDKAGVKGFSKSELNESIRVLEPMKEELCENGMTAQTAKNLAKEITGRVPLIYGYTPYYSVAFRFKTQINENAKYHTFTAEIPEMFHNEIMGWEGVQAASYYPIILRGKEESKRLKVRIDYFKEILNNSGISYGEIHSKGEGRLANQLSLLYIVDITSYFLALLHNTDPTPVNTISKLKKRINEEYSPLSKFEIELLK